MKLVHNLIKGFILAASVTSTATWAGDMLINTSVGDSTNDATGGDNFEIKKMDVKWDSDDNITIDIFTDFGNKNNDYRMGDHNIVFGDLLLGTGIAGQYDYAFSLGKLTSSRAEDKKYNNSDEWSDAVADGFERYYDYGSNQTHTNSTSGGLYAIDSTIMASEYHGKTNSDNKDGSVFAGNLNNFVSGGSWTINNNGNNWDVLSFTFNVNGISAFENAAQLSLSWAMSCFNDDIHSTLAVNRGTPTTTPVPEPSSLVIFSLALAGLAYRRKKA